MSPEKKDRDLTPVPSQTEQVGQIYESQEYSHDAVFGELTEGGPNYRNLGWLGTAAIMMKTQIGLGVLSIPVAFNTLGIVPGVLILCLISAITTWSDYIIGVFKLRHREVYSIDDAGQLMFGKIGKYFLGFTFCLCVRFSIPVYAAATISCVLVGYYSDKTGQRRFFTLGCYVAVFVGYLIAVAPVKFLPGLTYAGCFIAACGIYPAIPGLLALSSNNWAPNAKRAVGMAIQMGFGTMGGAAASNFYRSSDAPRYRLGHTLVLVFATLGLVTTAIYYLICRRVNAKREADGDNIHGYTHEDLIDLGDKAPSFRYKL